MPHSLRANSSQRRSPVFRQENLFHSSQHLLLLLVSDVAMSEMLARKLQPEENANIQVRKPLPPFFYLMTILKPNTTNNNLEFWNNIQSDSTELPDPLK